MKTNENKENNKLIIYTILLSESEPFYRVFTSSQNREEGKKHMNEIARLGGTGKLLEAKTPEEINNVFLNIAKVIYPNYGLKMNP